jgi:hypothetical protein
MSWDTDTYDELDQYDAAATPKKVGGLNLAALIDGNYDFTIQSAEMVRTPKTHDLLMRIHLRIDSGKSCVGDTVEWARFLGTQNNIDYLLGDLQTLGFFRQGSLKTWFPHVAKQLAGVRFRGQKFEKDGNHNLSVYSKIDPTKPMPSTIRQTPAVANGQATVAAHTEEEIPF